MSENDPQTYAIIGAAMEVHRELGHGFLERVYQEALAVEFMSRGILFGREVEVPVSYKGSPLNCGYCADFICYGEVVVELKVASSIDKSHVSQIINYLHATGFRRGLLLNFGSTSLEHRRLVH